jgi:hypothetical protein
LEIDMQQWLVTLLGCTFAVTGLPALAAERSLYLPKDECLHVKGYIDMRHRFEDIVRRRDAKALYAMAYSDIGLEIGGARGKQEFFRHWQLDRGRDSPVWGQLDQILRLGCYAESDRQVLMPHMQIHDPHWSADRVSEKALVLGENINLRTAADSKSASKGLLHWEFVEIADEGSGSGWTMVKTRNDKSGYVRDDFLRRHLDYRIGFIREGETWSLNLIQAGD